MRSWQVAQVLISEWTSSLARMVGAFGSGAGRTVATSGGGAGMLWHRMRSRMYLPRRVGEVTVPWALLARNAALPNRPARFASADSSTRFVPATEGNP